VLAQSQVRTPDLGGTSTTQDVGEAIAAAVSGGK
jgi:isocitrate/isopropylmalate dehydrogenase